MLKSLSPRWRTSLASLTMAASVAAFCVPGATPAAASVCGMPGAGYGRMFPTLPKVSWPQADVDNLAAAMIAPAEETVPSSPRDVEENVNIPAGFTYFGQFVDHDLTADNRPDDLTTPVDLSTVVNARTPQLDLDNVYGAGPSGSAKLYQSDRMHLVEGVLLAGSKDGTQRDLPRNQFQQAVIGDDRDDENRMVAGIHAGFIRWHNRTVDRLVAAHPLWPAEKVFAQARLETVRVYQQIVVREFLPTVVDRSTMNRVFASSGGVLRVRTRFYSPCQQMPVEFSVAAYRFGHSQVRAFYQLNDNLAPLPVFSGTYVPASDVSGFYAAPAGFGVDWSMFLPAPHRPRSGKLQYSYLIDTSLTHSLSLLPLPVSGAGPANLAERNVLRSVQLSLPSGQAVARAVGVPVLRPGQILVGKATLEPSVSKPISVVAPSMASSTPLWVYVLAVETANAFKVVDGKVVGSQRAPFTLGPVGSTIVAETFAGLLASDPSSIVGVRLQGPSVTLWDVLVPRPAGR